MSVARGPTRIILLRSGVYDYAELPLHESLHLVGGNNVGKTSLIAALQFLYIEDMKQMHFSKDLTETRRHYFPETGSLVLFECMTPTGFQVFGLRGLGPVQGFDVERFAFNGAFSREDFLEGRQARTWSEVARRLLDRELRQMEPKHLRASLTGVGDAKGPPLGIVPLKRSGSFESFRTLFRNLLRLSRISQKELKELFIDITPNLRKTEIDLRKDYAELFQKVERQAQDVEALREVEPLIIALTGDYLERRGARGRLAAMWQAIESMLAQQQRAVDAQTSQLDAERAALQAEAVVLKEKHEAAVAEGNKLSKQAGGLEEKQRNLEVLRDTVRGFVPELEAVMRDQLQRDYDALAARLQIAARADRAQVERGLADVERRLREDRRLVERFSDALVTWLRANSGLDDARLGDIFGVLDPELLGEVLGEGRVVVTEPKEALALVREIASRFDASGFSGAGVHVRRRSTDKPSPLAAYADMDSIRGRIGENEVIASDLHQKLSDIREREGLEMERDALNTQRNAAEERLRAWTKWNEQKSTLDDITRELAALRQRIQNNAAQENTLSVKLTENALSMKDVDTKAKEARAVLKRQSDEVGRLNPAPALWKPLVEGQSFEGQDLDNLTRTYRIRWSEHTAQSTRVEQLLADVKNKTAERILGENDDDTVAQLQDELTALADRERAVAELWASLVDGLRNAFKSLLDSLEEVRREVSRLTAALGRRQVSNLERVELELVQQKELIQPIRAVIEAADAPLFAGSGGRSRAALDVQKWLKDRPNLKLIELFDLRFKVQDVRGQVKTFDALSQIESQGTSTTITVLVHLELIRSLLADDDVSVPFFLDEAAKLDPPNQRALNEHAVHMHFVPIFASPEPRDCVDTLYFLRPQAKGRLVLDETSRVRLRVGAPDAS